MYHLIQVPGQKQYLIKTHQDHVHVYRNQDLNHVTIEELQKMIKENLSAVLHDTVRCYVCETAVNAAILFLPALALLLYVTLYKPSIVLAACAVLIASSFSRCLHLISENGDLMRKPSMSQDYLSFVLNVAYMISGMFVAAGRSDYWFTGLLAIELGSLAWRRLRSFRITQIKKTIVILQKAIQTLQVTQNDLDAFRSGSHTFTFADGMASIQFVVSED